MTTPFIQARWYHQGRQGHAIRLLVIHDMEAPEKSTTAEAVARYFSTTDRKASAHYCVDNDSVVQCVKDGDTAFGAAGANTDGLHFEQAGYARQSTAEWLDAYGLAMLGELGVLLRSKSTEHGIPLRWLTVAQVADGLTRGLCTHGDVSAAFPKVSTGHTDPGVNYPKDRALAIWRGSDDPSEEDDMDMETFQVTDGPDKGQLWLRQGGRYDRIPTPAVYSELQRLLPGRGLDKPTRIDNAVVWAFLKADGDATSPGILEAIEASRDAVVAVVTAEGAVSSGRHRRTRDMIAPIPGAGPD